MKKVFYKPYISIAFLLLSLLFLSFNFIFKDYNHDGYNEVYLDYVVDAKEGNDGVTAYLDSDTTVFCVDADGEMIYRIESKDDKDNPAYLGFCFDDNNHLYIHSIVFEKDAYLTNSERIEEYDAEGNFVKYVALFDYSDSDLAPQRVSRITGLNYLDDHIRYLYVESNGNTTMYSCNLSNLITEAEGTYNADSNVRICRAVSYSNGDYGVTLNNGTIGKLDKTGELVTFAVCEYDTSMAETAYIPVDMYMVNDEIYVVSGLYIDKVYKVDESGINYVCSKLELTGDDSFSQTIDFVGQFNGQLVVGTPGLISYLDSDGNVTDTEDPIVDIGFISGLQAFLKDFSLIVSVPLGLIGIILLIGFIAKWRASLLLKQLVLTIPIVILLVVALVMTMRNSMANSYYDTLTHEMVAINELIANGIDGSEIDSIKDMSSVDDGTIQKYCDYLNESIQNNNGYWNKKYDIGIYIHDKDKRIFLKVASNTDYIEPFRSANFSFNEDNSDGDDESALNDTDSIVTYIEDGGEITSLIVDSPIYNEAGEQIAVLELSADMSTVNDNIAQMTRKVMNYAIIFLPLLCLALGIVSYINIRHLNKLSDVVSNISEGDFKARINKIPKDEVGEICSSVNQMAEQLDDYFSTMDRNEKFYYKFVPEKFKELLHKDELTDLTLGDAESADLTVLFCDIRAFSLNSEMMTAKENFEFVNIIYGKAGPIIRRNNGFVDKYIGDAIMALFENADDAIKAGREMYQEIVLNPETAKELHVSSINIGIGIHSGMARIGIVGEDERMSGTVISNTVNLSSRLESLTKKYAAAMLISKDTLDRLENPEALNTRYLGMIQVAGVNEVKAVYEVLDCLAPEDEKFKTSQKAEFKEAIRLFHLGQQEKSLSLMKELKKQKDDCSANDPCLDMYVEYIENGIIEGDKDTKIFRFNRK